MTVAPDPDVIRRWAARNRAEPATGEATASGPATIDINDGGVGIRFNFPAMARLRPISWEEWFEHMDRHHLVFVYEALDDAVAWGKKLQADRRFSSVIVIGHSEGSLIALLATPRIPAASGQPAKDEERK